MKEMLKNPFVMEHFSVSDIDAVRAFLERPNEYMSGHEGRAGTSEMQVAQNPFGDYAPRSTQIQGILKSMYDTFAKDMEKNNVDEANQQKAFEELMATKKREEATLRAELQKQETFLAEKTKQKADNLVELDDVKETLAADEKVFAETKAGCQEKASQWSTRTMLRTQELEGIAQAIGILTSEDSKKIFEKAHKPMVEPPSPPALIQMLASIKKRHRTASGGKFDKIIADIDSMIAKLRKEESDDNAHRDRCQGAEGKNKNDMEDLNSGIAKAEGEVTRLEDEQNTTLDEIANLEKQTAETEQEIKAMTEMREQENAEFKEALEYDKKAIKLIEMTIERLKHFYKSNGIPLLLVAGAQDPEYTVDADKPPQVSWNANYTGTQGETHGIVEILEMLAEDLQNEIDKGREMDAEAQEQYLKTRADQEASIHAMSKLKEVKSEELAELQDSSLDNEQKKSALLADLEEEEKLKKALYSDCSWVATHFDSRREKRKTEIQGLQDAKNYLAGGGDELAL